MSGALTLHESGLGGKKKNEPKKAGEESGDGRSRSKYESVFDLEKTS